jgi:hypothetical protein
MGIMIKKPDDGMSTWPFSSSMSLDMGYVYGWFN